MISNPTPQRELRSHRPQRPAPRVLNTAEHHAWLAGHLTARDRWLCRMLFEHHVLTSTQIIDIAFPSRRAANLRLRNLYQWGVVHRFQPHRDRGSHPMHYVLDTAGAVALAREDGIDPRELGYNREREIGRAFSLQLAHTVGCNGLFTALIHRALQPGTTGALTTWWSAARCGRHWGDIVTPDGYGRWREADRDIEWFIEFDFGTETLTRLARKLARYERLAENTGITTPVLVWLPTAAREANARRAFADALRALNRPDRVPVATTSGETTDDPLDMAAPRWRRVEDTRTTGRVRLTELPVLWPELPASPPLSEPRPAPAAAGRVEVAPPSPMPPPAPAGR
ncbi:replication-relaxation family protein [Amycolatopsis jejuensis]|uniref:replication-relaxation family protein n=1 Tax=Amycolatopsis jejuensis TaxID=330084 RepID=UPI000524C00E|nr:replication-relaxation family protein [Amycolatopsis jejuensis]